MARNVVTYLSLLALLFPLALVAQQQQTEKVKERVIYIPYDKLEALVQKTDTGIYLPYEDYKRLLAEVEKAQQRPPEIPDMVLISDVSYTCKAVDSFLEVEASYRLDSLKEGWHSVALGFQNTAIREASLDGKPAFLKLNGDAYELLFKSLAASQHQLKVSFVVPAVLQKNLETTVQFRVPRAAIARLSLDIPHNEETPAKMEVEVKPSLTMQTTSDAASTKVTALLGNTDNIAISWKSQAERKVEIKRIVHAENSSYLKIGEDFLNLLSRVRYDVIQGDVKTLRINIPKGFDIFSVKSTRGVGIQDWTLEKDGTLLQVNLLKEAKDLGEGQIDLELEIKLEKVIKQLVGQFSVPVLDVLEVERENGYYTIFLSNDLHTLKIVDRRDINQIDLNDLPDYARLGQVHFAFNYLKRPFTLNVELQKVDPEYEVFTNVAAYLDETLYKLQAHFRYNIKKSRIFQSEIEIPSDFRLLSARAYDFKAKSKHDRGLDQIKEHVEKDYLDSEGNKKKMLLLIFKSGMNSANLVVRLQFQKKFAEEQQKREIELPVFRVRGAKRETGNVAIGVDESFNITTVENSQKNVVPLDKRELFHQGDRPQVQRVNIGLRYYEFPIAAKFSVEKRDPLIVAEVFDYISIDDNVLKHQFRLYYTVKYSGVKKFSFTLPEEIAKDVPISRITDQLGLIKETTTEANKEAKTVLYTVHTHREVPESYHIDVAYEKKLQRLEVGQILEIPVFELITQETNRESGFLVFKKNNNFSLQFSDLKLLEPADAQDIPSNRRDNLQNASEIFKYASHGYTLNMVLRKLEFAEVLNTVIYRLHLVTSVNKNLETHNTAIVRLINSRKQFLDFELPQGHKVMAVGRLNSVPGYREPVESIVRNRLDPMTPSKRADGKGFRVNITSHIKKGAPLVLFITYSNKSDLAETAKMSYSGQFSLAPITFSDVPITYFTWDLGLPSDYEYMKFDSDLVRAEAAREYGIWNGLFGISNVDNTIIKQDADTGVIPDYQLIGKGVGFAKLNGGGYIRVDYMLRNWLNALYLLVFIGTCALVVVVPRFKIISHLHLVLVLVTVSLLLNTLNLQGYQGLYAVVLLGALTSGTGVFTVQLFQRQGSSSLFAAKSPKADKGHTLYRDNESKKNDDVEIINDKGKENSGGDSKGKENSDGDSSS